ncbi:MAG: NUDIX hydrolase [bacterium]
MNRGSYPFKLLAKGPFTHQQVQVRWNGQPRQYSESVQAGIDDYWRREVEQSAKSEYLFNGDLCRLANWQASGQGLTLILEYTNYKELLYSNYVRDQRPNPAADGFVSAALGISLILVSQDHQIVLIRRTETVGESPGKLDVIGGHVEPYAHQVAGRPDPFRAMQAELAEEAHLSVDSHADLLCLGLLVTTQTEKPELIFLLNSRTSLKEILAASAAQPSPEIAELLSVEDDQDTLHALLLAKKAAFSPSALGALWLYKEMMEKLSER